jgi:hypothetical protein
MDIGGEGGWLATEPKVQSRRSASGEEEDVGPDDVVPLPTDWRGGESA